MRDSPAASATAPARPARIAATVGMATAMAAATPGDTERRQHPEVVRRPADLPVDRDGCGDDRRHAEHRSEDDEPHRQGVEGRAEGARELAHNRTGERLARLVDRRRAREAVDERRRVGARDDTDHAADPERREVGMRVGERGRQVGRGERRLVTAPDLEELADDTDHLDLGHLLVATADGLTGLVVHEEGSVGDAVAHADPEPPGVLLGDDRLASGAGVGEPSLDQAAASAWRTVGWTPDSGPGSSSTERRHTGSRRAADRAGRSRTRLPPPAHS